MDKILAHVKDCINSHNGGEKFFDYLDEKIRADRDLLHQLTFFAIKDTQADVVVLSGKFGEECADYIHDLTGMDVIVLEGGLRHNAIKNPEMYAMELNGRTAIFLDDTYFAGRTSNSVQELVENCFGQFLGTYVVYDGSPAKKPHVNSLFRYYDYFGRERK